MYIVNVFKLILCIVLAGVIISICGGDSSMLVSSIVQNKSVEDIQTVEDPMEAYLAALDKTNALSDFEYSSIMNSYACEGETHEYTADSSNTEITMKTKIKNYAEDSMQLKTAITIEMADMGSLTEDLYYDNGYLYIAVGVPGVGQQKGKVSISVSELCEDFDMSMQTYKDSSAVKEAIETAQFGQNERTIKLVFDGQKFQNLLSQIMGSYSSYMQESSNYTVSEMEVVVELTEDGYIMSQQMDYFVTDESSGETEKWHMSVAYSNIGQSVHIDFPDFSEYLDMGTYADLNGKTG
ncbi:MAG: hypothetical protein ACI4GO_05815 [Hominenteromicrobium sp.]